MQSSIEYRCKCGKLLFKGLVLHSVIEIKCKRCDAIMSVGGISDYWDEENYYSLVVDHHAQIVSCSDSAIKILGYTRLELLKMSVGDLNMAIQPGMYENLWEKMRRTRDSFSIDVFQRTKNGQMIPAKVFTRFLGFRNEEYAVVVVERLRELPEAVFKGEFSLDREFVSKYVSDFAAETNLKGICTYISEKSLLTLGYSADEIIGKLFFELYPDQERDRRIREYQSLVYVEQPFRILDSRILRKDGDFLPFNAYFVPRHDDMGGFFGYSIVSWFF